MARAPMEGRVEEIQLGCYGQQGAPCCWLMSLSWKDSDRTVIVRVQARLLLLHRLLPGLLRRSRPGKRQREFQSEGCETLNFQTPTSFTMTGGMAKGETYRKMC